MSGFPEGTVIIRDVRMGLVCQRVTLPSGVRHTAWMVPEDADYRTCRVETLEHQRRSLEKADIRL